MVKSGLKCWRTVNLLTMSFRKQTLQTLRSKWLSHVNVNVDLVRFHCWFVANNWCIHAKSSKLVLFDLFRRSVRRLLFLFILVTMIELGFQSQHFFLPLSAASYATSLSLALIHWRSHFDRSHCLHFLCRFTRCAHILIVFLIVSTLFYSIDTNHVIRHLMLHDEFRSLKLNSYRNAILGTYSM